MGTETNGMDQQYVRLECMRIAANLSDLVMSTKETLETADAIYKFVLGTPAPVTDPA